ncbi:MAG: adenylate/guanylate cyclase domain-containing protein [Cyanobacteria bacterium P01_H01_bin.58]
MPMPPQCSAEEQLVALLQQRHQHPAQAAAIDAEIRDRFLQTCAAVILDMVGFSRKTQGQGIIATLQEIYQMRAIAVPLMEKHSGTILKLEADNVYAKFATPDAALSAAIAVLQQLNAADLHASLGIGYGDMLAIGEQDLYGDEMNLASKLGEDIAEDDEILLTEAAHNFLSGTSWQFDVFTKEVSNLTLTVYQVQQQEAMVPPIHA